MTVPVKVATSFLAAWSSSRSSLLRCVIDARVTVHVCAYLSVLPFLSHAMFGLVVTFALRSCHADTTLVDHSLPSQHERRR